MKLGHALALTLLLSACESGEGVSLMRVIDGDTFHLTSGEKIRILEIDTPELFSAKCSYELTHAILAKAELSEILQSGTLTLSREGTDRYGRTLAHVYVDGTSVADLMLRSGLARPYGNGRKPWCP